MNQDSAFAIISTEEPPLVGRERELLLCIDACKRASGGGALFLAICAPSGMGKSRLLKAVSVAAQELQFNCFAVRGAEHLVNSPYSAIRKLAQQCAAYAEKDSEYAAHLARSLELDAEGVIRAAPELAAVLAPVAGVDTAELADEDKLTIVLASLLSALGSAKHPALLIIDDAQWIDEPSLRVLHYWRTHRRADTVYLATMVGYRAEFVETQKQIAELRPNETVTLSPFDAGNVTHLLTELGGLVSQDAAAMVFRLSGGNPFMVQCIFRGLIDSGVVKREADQWTLPGNLEQTLVADSSEFLARRLAILSHRVREFLLCGSLLGREFDPRVAASMGDIAPGEIDQCIEEAESRVIVHKVKGGAIEFVHDKLREAVLAACSAERLRDLQRRAAAALTQYFPERLAEIASHYDLAGDPALAFKYAWQAAEQMRYRSLSIAEKYYRIAERHMSSEDVAVQRTVECQLAWVLTRRARYAEAEAVLHRANALTRNPVERAALCEQLAELFLRSSNVAAGMRAVTEGLSLLGEKIPGTTRAAAELLYYSSVQVAHSLFPKLFLHRTQHQDKEKELLAVRLWYRFGHFAFFQCKNVATMSVSLRGLSKLERGPVSGELAFAYASHAAACSVFAWFSRSFKYGHRAVAIAREAKAAVDEAYALTLLGACYYVSARCREALCQLTEADRLLDRIGDSWTADLARCNIAYCLYRLGSLERAAVMAERVFHVAFDIADYIPAACALSVWAKSTGGALPDAIVGRAVEKLNCVDLQSAVEIRQAIALWYRHQGDYAAATEMLRRGWAQIATAPVKQDYVLSVVPWLVTTLREQSEISGANRDELLKEAWLLVQRGEKLTRRFKNNRPHILREAALLCAGRGDWSGAERYFQESWSEAKALHALHEMSLTKAAHHKVGGQRGWASLV